MAQVEFNYEIDTHRKARRSDPSTSRDAWDRMVGQVGSVRRRVYEELRLNGPGDYVEIARRTGIAEVTVSGRLTELRRRGLAQVVEKRDGRSVYRNR